MIMQNLTEQRLRQALRDLLRLLDSADKCDLCLGPTNAFDSCHEKQWRLLRARIQVLLKQDDAKKPN